MRKTAWNNDDGICFIKPSTTLATNPVLRCSTMFAIWVTRLDPIVAINLDEVICHHWLMPMGKMTLNNVLFFIFRFQGSRRWMRTWGVFLHCVINQKMTSGLVSILCKYVFITPRIAVNVLQDPVHTKADLLPRFSNSIWSKILFACTRTRP